jgi:hypothetical protein
MSTANSYQVNSLSQSTDWLTGWQYRKGHTIDGALGAGTNYQVRITVQYEAGVDANSDVFCHNFCQNDFEDIRFTDDDGSTLLDYWLEEYTPYDNAIFWVEVSDNLDTAQSIYIYFGNPRAGSETNGEATFPFFDDFNDNFLDTSKWEEWHTAGSVTEFEGLLTVNGGASGWQSLGGTTEFSYDHSFEMRAFASTDSSNAVQFGADERSADGNAPNGYNSAYFDYYDGSFCTSRRNSLQEATMRSVPLDVFAHWAIHFHSSILRFYHDDSLIATHTVNVPTTSMGLWIADIYSESVSFDWAFTRKCVDSEPSHGIWQNIETLDPATVAHWPFNEGFGSTLYDLSGNGNDGSISGAYYTPGAMDDNALHFDGNNDYVEMDQSPSLRSIADEYTFEAIFKLSSYGSQAGCTLFQMASETGGNVFIVVANEIPSDNRIRIAAMTGTQGDEIFDFNYVIPLDQWVALCVTKSNNGNLDLYINGSYIETLTGFPQIQTYNLDTAFIGADADTSMELTDFFDGFIDEIRIYNSTLTNSEIYENYASFFDIASTSTSTTETTTVTSVTSNTGGITTPTPPAVFPYDVMLGVLVGGVVVVVVILIAIIRLRPRSTSDGYVYG